MAPEVPFVVRIRFPLAALIALAGAALADVRIDARSSIVIDPSEPAALRRAAADLASDMSKVFGATPAVVGSSDAASSSAVHVCLSARSCDGLRPGGAEVLAIRAVPGGVMLTGSDLRGAIYAVYEFSRRFLGVDPFYYWNDHEPARMVSVRIPADASIQDGPPQFRYRGWFINDEDLFTGWKPDPASGFSLELWDKIFETLLRVKGNMIVPGTFLFPDEPQVAAASERGLIIDSISHFWAGEGGLLDEQSAAAKKTGNSYTAWRDVTPKHNRLIEGILASPLHVIATMRSKVDYVMETNDRGKQVPKKVGLAPIQREGMDYEFTTVFDIGIDGHLASPSKDRTGLFDGWIGLITEETGKKMRKWLEEGGEPAPSFSEIVALYRKAGLTDAAIVERVKSVTGRANRSDLTEPDYFALKADALTLKAS